MRRTAWISLAMAAVFCLTGLATTASAQTYTLKIGIGHAPGHSFTVASEKFKELVEKRTNKRIKVEIYPSSQLGGEREMQEMVSLGTLEMTVTGVHRRLRAPLCPARGPVSLPGPGAHQEDAPEPRSWPSWANP